MQATFVSPLGPLTLTEADGQITALSWQSAPHDPTPLLAEAFLPSFRPTLIAAWPDSTCRCTLGPG